MTSTARSERDLPRLKSVSFLPLTDHEYAQAPYQAITKEAYELASSKIVPLDFEAINTDEAQDMYCDGDKCELIIPEHVPEQQEVEFPAPEESKSSKKGRVEVTS